MDLGVNNPVEKVDPPKIMPFEGKPFTADELQKLLDATKDDRMGLVILVTAMYGLRRSEVLGLRWRAIDFQNNLLTINHTLTEVNVKGNTELAEVDAEASQCVRELTEAFARADGINERLKAINSLQWAREMNNCKARAEEIVLREVVFR
ncbi:MAG: TnpV protein [Eubacteriales bacterium]|nr:TnpV protein [Eubacteriales bacterium]